MKTVTNPEYLRRNLLVCSAYGAVASIEKAIEHTRKLKRQPKWLLRHLQMAHERAVKLPPALVCYRSAAPIEIPVRSESADRIVAEIMDWIESPTKQHKEGPNHE
jgi:hypothetical protein